MDWPGGSKKLTGSGYLVMPAAAAGIDPAAHATPWATGAYSQVIASTAEAEYIEGVSFAAVLASVGAKEGELDIATGAGGAEVVISTIPANVPSDTTGEGGMCVVFFPYPIAVAAATRIAVSQRTDVASKAVFTNVKLIYVKQSNVVAL